MLRRPEEESDISFRRIRRANFGVIFEYDLMRDRRPVHLRISIILKPAVIIILSVLPVMVLVVCLAVCLPLRPVARRRCRSDILIIIIFLLLLFSRRARLSCR